MRRPKRKYVISSALAQAWSDLLRSAGRLRRGHVLEVGRVRGYATLIEALEWWRTSEYPRFNRRARRLQ